MSDRDVKTIRDLTYYQYAKIVGRRESFTIQRTREALGLRTKTYLKKIVEIVEIVYNIFVDDMVFIGYIFLCSA